MLRYILNNILAINKMKIQPMFNIRVYNNNNY